MYVIRQEICAFVGLYGKQIFCMKFQTSNMKIVNAAKVCLGVNYPVCC